MSLWSRFRNAIRNDRLIDDIDEELSSHLAEAVAHGRDPDEARRALGPRLQHREASWDVRRIAWLGDFLVDVRYGARRLRREPVFFATAVLSLAIGIGANAAIYSLIEALLLRPLPVSHAEQLVTVADTVTANFSYPEYVSMRESTRMLSGLIAASSTATLRAGSGGDVEAASVKIVSGDYFAALGIAAGVGRVFTSAEELQPVAVISQSYWRRRFGASVDAIGRATSVDGVTLTIVGVAPPGFSGEAPGESPDIWASMALQAPAMREDRGFTWLYLIGRRRPGATFAQIHDDLASPLVQRRSTAPAAETRSRLRVAPGARGQPTLRDRLLDPLRVSMVLAIIVLLVVCTNLAGLLLARGTARRPEIAIRLAIGACRTRVIRQLLAEGLLLAGMGGSVGILLAVWGRTALLGLPVGSKPIVLDAGLNVRILAFTAGVSVAAGLLCGLIPAWRATRGAAVSGSSRILGHRRGGRVRHALIAIQVALSMVLLAAGLMFVRTVRNLETQDLGFRADHVLVIPVVAERGYRPTLSLLVPELLARVSRVPGVTSATVALGGTFGAIGGVRVQVEGSGARDRLSADWVGPDYLRTAGINLVAGRDFSVTDEERHQKVVIVNETMARRYFGNARVLGRRVTFNRDSFEIVGVAADAKYFYFRETTPSFVYFPTLQTQSGFNALEIRMAGAAPLAMASTLGSLVHDMDRHLHASVAVPLSDRIDRRLGRERVVADAAALLGAVALALLSIGIYGSVAYTVGERAKEIAVRLALGAHRTTIVWMVLRQIARVLAVGLLAGGVAVLLAGRLVKPLLFGVTPADPVTLVGAAVVLVAIAAVAAGVPARAASRLDPAAVLQE